MNLFEQLKQENNEYLKIIDENTIELQEEMFCKSSKKLWIIDEIAKGEQILVSDNDIHLELFRVNRESFDKNIVDIKLVDKKYSDFDINTLDCYYIDSKVLWSNMKDGTSVLRYVKNINEYGGFNEKI